VAGFPAGDVGELVAEEFDTFIEGIAGDGIAVGVLEFDAYAAGGGGGGVHFEMFSFENQGAGDQLAACVRCVDGEEAVGADG